MIGDCLFSFKGIGVGRRVIERRYSWKFRRRRYFRFIDVFLFYFFRSCRRGTAVVFRVFRAFS